VGEMKIDSTTFGSIKIEGKEYKHDVIVNWKGEVKKGWLQTRHLVNKKEFFDLAKENPEVIVIGNGQYGACEVSEDFIKLAKEKGIELVIEDTSHAIQKFNELAKKGKKVVAYMHVTC
jgi:hypothetical protein